MDCSNFVPVMYKEAQLKGVKVLGKAICTRIYGKSKMCGGTWSIEENMQGQCGLEPTPWNIMMLASDGADLFAVDAAQFDSSMNPHDCHNGLAIRQVMLR
jgi:hypothetical protein